MINGTKSDNRGREQHVTWISGVTVNAEIYLEETYDYSLQPLWKQTTILDRNEVHLRDQRNSLQVIRQSEEVAQYLSQNSTLHYVFWSRTKLTLLKS